MGKGDKKTKRGKILMGSHGVRRARRKHAKAIPLIAMKEEKPVAAVKVKAPEKPVAAVKVKAPEKPVTVVKEKAPPKPKAVKADVQVETPKVTASVKDAVKPARKKAPPKGSAKKETA